MREREFVELTGFYYYIAGLMPPHFLPILRKSFFYLANHLISEALSIYFSSSSIQSLFVFHFLVFILSFLLLTIFQKP